MIAKVSARMTAKRRPVERKERPYVINVDVWKPYGQKRMMRVHVMTKDGKRQKTLSIANKKEVKAMTRLVLDSYREKPLLPSVGGGEQMEFI